MRKTRSPSFVTRMEVEEKFIKAFGDLQRYELYQLLRGWGTALIAVGIGYFLTSFRFVMLLWFTPSWFRQILDRLTDEEEGALFQFLVFGVFGIVFAIVAITVALIMIATYLSVRRTRTKNCGVVTGRMRRFGASLFILFVFTFYYHALTRLDLWLSFVPGWWTTLTIVLYPYLGILLSSPMYLTEVGAVFSAYALLRAEIKDHDFAEIRVLGFLLLALCIIEPTWGIVLWGALAPLGAIYPVGYMIGLMAAYYYSYPLLDFALLVLYVIGGWKSWKRADQVLRGI